MNVTIREVARTAGVAVSTVSLVLNRKGRVSRET
ncbi:MAG TPA: LacI family DNA-binding transcriptional regulator, partial [bacterium]|nr:LacI family DNA-binding transcriptional regulator [bacterium]